MIVNLYAVRITLKVLGFEDYGIYNAIGGVVAMFAFISNTLTSVSQRYFSYYLGKNEPLQLRRYFNIVFLIYVFISLFIVILGESLGIWLLNDYLNIPEERFSAAQYVYQFSLFSLAISFITIPYNSIIIAREEMNVYAYASIVESLLRLGVVFLLMKVVSWDSLKLYAFLLMTIVLLKFFFYASYTHKKYVESRLMRYWDWAIVKELAKYLGWNTYGVLATVVKNQGVVIILNIFFGPVINAAYAIAMQIHNAVYQFASSFLLAVQPQIVKKHAENNNHEMMSLVFLSSRFSYYLIMIVAIPCIIELPCVLRLWLTEYPDYTIGFSILLILSVLIESMCTPLVTSIQATGRIKAYNIVLGSFMLFSVPICILFAKICSNPYVVPMVSIAMAVIGQIIRIYYIWKLTGMSIMLYCKEVLLQIFIVTAVSVAIPVVIALFTNDTVWRLVYLTGISICCSLVTIYFVGIKENERLLLKNLIKQKILKK